MLEVYEAYGDQHTMAALMRDMFLAAADAIGSRRVETPAGVVDLGGEWPWLPVYDAVSAAVGEEVTLATPAARLRELLERHDLEFDPAWGAEKLALELLSELVEPTLVQPTFLCDYPAVAQPLARPHRSEPGLIEAWDLIIAGVERGTGFSELVDPVVQREVLTAQSVKAAGGDPEAMQLDEDFLRALEYGAPPMGGLGLGLDRMIMLFTGVGIRETILFPHLRREAR
jgi:lysyl-tRNA synthetase class 2